MCRCCLKKNYSNEYNNYKLERQLNSHGHNLVKGVENGALVVLAEGGGTRNGNLNENVGEGADVNFVDGDSGEMKIGQQDEEGSGHAHEHEHVHEPGIRNKMEVGYALEFCYVEEGVDDAKEQGIELNVGPM